MAKTYIEGASCKTINGQFGEFYNISFNMEKLQQYVNEKGYVNIVMSKRKEVGQYGDTHYFTLNEWNPETAPNSNTNNNQSQTISDSNEEISIEDIPF